MHWVGLHPTQSDAALSGLVEPKALKGRQVSTWGEAPSFYYRRELFKEFF